MLKVGCVLFVARLDSVLTLHAQDRATHPDTAPATDALSHQTLEQIRAEFINDLYIACKQRQLTLPQTEHPGFGRFVAWFERKHKNFPLTTSLAQVWAIGERDPGEELALELRYAAAAKPVGKPSLDSRQSRAQDAVLGAQILALMRSGIFLTQRACANNPVLFAGIGGGIVLLFAIQGMLHRRRPAHSTRVVAKQSAYTVIFNSARNETIFLPIKTDCAPQLIVAETASSGETIKARAEPESLSVLPVDAEWENQLRLTEERAQQLLAQVRAGLAPHLARQMTTELVRKLVDDRARLLEAQRIASAEIATLEQRFGRIHSELQKRLREYQARNIELEKQLAERSDQNRQLLRSQIVTLQNKLQQRSEVR